MCTRFFCKVTSKLFTYGVFSLEIRMNVLQAAIGYIRVYSQKIDLTPTVGSFLRQLGLGCFDDGVGIYVYSDFRVVWSYVLSDHNQEGWNFYHSPLIRSTYLFGKKKKKEKKTENKKNGRSF